MHEKLQRVFDEHARPQHASPRQLREHVVPLMRLHALVNRQITEYRLLIHEAQLSPDHEPIFDTLVENGRQTLGALEREGAALIDHFDRYVNSAVQLDTFFAEWQGHIQTVTELRTSGKLPPRQLAGVPEPMVSIPANAELDSTT